MTPSTDTSSCNTQSGVPPEPPEAHRQAAGGTTGFDLLAVIATADGIEVAGYSIVRTHMLPAGAGSEAFIQMLSDDEDTAFWFYNQPVVLNATGVVIANDAAGVRRELWCRVSRPVTAHDVVQMLERRARMAAGVAAAKGGRV